MNKRGTWWKVLIVLLVVAFVWLNPALRAVVLWLLPLGSGPDDIVGVFLVIALVGLALTYGVDQLRKRKKALQEAREEEETKLISSSSD